MIALEFANLQFVSSSTITGVTFVMLLITTFWGAARRRDRFKVYYRGSHPVIGLLLVIVAVLLLGVFFFAFILARSS